MTLKLRPDERSRMDDLRTMSVVSSETGARVPLDQIGSFAPEFIPPKIGRRDNERCMIIKCDIAPGMLTSVVYDHVEARLATAMKDWPAGYHFQIGGEKEEQGKGFGSLAIAMVVSILSIYLALILQFNSLAKPLVVFAAVPFGMIGGLMGLIVFGVPLGFFALLGVSSLVGVIISHVIVLFEYIEEAHERGEPLRRAVIDAALVRLRPVLVTVLATVGGLIPLALRGGPLWEPLCYVQIMGLLIATLVTKVVVPVLYVLFVEDFKLIRWEAPDGRRPRKAARRVCPRLSHRPSPRARAEGRVPGFVGAEWMQTNESSLKHCFRHSRACLGDFGGSGGPLEPGILRRGTGGEATARLAAIGTGSADGRGGGLVGQGRRGQGRRQGVGMPIGASRPNPRKGLPMRIDRRIRLAIVAAIVATFPEEAVQAEDLATAWSVALASNRQLQSQQFQTRSTELSLAASRTARLPTVRSFVVDAMTAPNLNVVGTAITAGASMGGSQGRTPGSSQSNFPIVNTSLNYSIYTGGRLKANVDAASANLGAQRFQEFQTALDLKLTVADAYVSVLRSVRSLEVARSDVARLDAFARDVRNRLAVGRVTRNDELASEVSLANAKQTEIRARRTLATAWATYNRYLCRPLSEVVDLEDLTADPGLEGKAHVENGPLSDKPTPGAGEDEVLALTSQAFAIRPELGRLSEQARSLEAQSRATRAGIRPQLSIMAGYTYLGAEFLENKSLLTSLVVVDWTLTDFGTTRRRALAQRNQEFSTLRQRGDIADSIALEVRVGLARGPGDPAPNPRRPHCRGTSPREHHLRHGSLPPGPEHLYRGSRR